MKKKLSLFIVILAGVLMLESCGLRNLAKDIATVILESTIFGRTGNYSLELTVTPDNGDAAISTKYEVCRKVIRYSYEIDGKPASNYLVTSGKKKGSVVPYKDGNLLISSDSIYYPYINDFQYFGLGNLTDMDFNINDGVMTLKKSSAVDTVCKNIVGNRSGEEYEETFDYLAFSVESGFIVSAEMRSSVVSGNIRYGVTYSLTFSDHGTHDFDLPENTMKLSDDELFATGLLPRSYYLNNAAFNSLPAKGSPKILVVPVAFPNFNMPSGYDGNISVILNGKTSYKQSGYSVHDYYSKSSNGQLDLKFKITDLFVTSKPSSYYENIQRESAKNGYAPDGADAVLEEVMAFLNEKYDLSEYDSDGDNFIDGIYLIYFHGLSNEKGRDNLWWSWETLSCIRDRLDGVYVGSYVWISYNALFTSGYSQNYLYTSSLIHETGHLLGLDDYYDTNVSVGPAGGFGGGDMMDSGVGDHCPASKILLGWTEPVVITGSESYVSLKKYALTSECAVIFKDPELGTAGEFITIDFYSPDNLYDSVDAKKHGLPSISGFRICHVDATVDPDALPFPPYNHLYNNSTTEHKFIRMIEADGKYDIETGKATYTSNSDLFVDGTTFGADFTWYDGTPLGLTLEFVVEPSYMMINICNTGRPSSSDK